ncbi:hypothetical protein HU200_067342 [Digitaria exilis]|uniref:Uncharacterized protein n=1 Tax=Digitaria exilis TaxID=1010633 RepID=A0A835A664_9POAL|nr:hypothetical protein HU200_067342 [Digitaria exilis]
MIYGLNWHGILLNALFQRIICLAEL